MSTAPRWIAEAFDVMMAGPGAGDPELDRLAAALIERLPLEAVTMEIRQRIAGVAGITGDWIGAIAGLAASGAAAALTGDPEVVTLTELYQGACSVLDAAGVPYKMGGGDHLAVRLNLAGRILWLIEQRPTRLELQRVEAERDAWKEVVDGSADAAVSLAESFLAGGESPPLHPNTTVRLARGVIQLREERDAARRDYRDALADLDADRTEYAAAGDAFASSIADASIERDKLSADRDSARLEIECMRRRFDDLKRERDQLVGDLNQLHGDLDTTERKLRDAERDLQRSRY